MTRQYEEPEHANMQFIKHPHGGVISSVQNSASRLEKMTAAHIVFIKCVGYIYSDEFTV